MSRTRRAAALAAFAVALTGCQGIVGSQYTQVRYVDASPDAPALDVYQNSAASLYNVSFGTVSSYIPMAPGPLVHAVNTAGTQQQIATVHGLTAAGAQYTVLVGNVAADLQMTVLKDQSAPAPAGQVALRFVHQATRAGRVDIYLLAPNATLTNAVPLLSNVAFGNTPAYINVPSGAYTLAIVPSGVSMTATTLSPTPAPLLHSGNQVTYPATSARTFILIDQPASVPPGVQVILADDYDPPAPIN